MARTKQKRKGNEAGMSFRWYCPDQVITVISQNEVHLTVKPRTPVMRASSTNTHLKPHSAGLCGRNPLSIPFRLT